MPGNRDIVVIGSSSGGLPPLVSIVRSLPQSLAASVLVVRHIGPAKPSMLSQILARETRLRVKEATDGESLERGVAYCAVPDRHLMVHDSRIALGDGPRENRSRPAIDALFRSAAQAFGSRVIGVVLSGYLNDGAAGLSAIERAGGVAIVQDPDEAEGAGMPAAAIAAVSEPRIAPREQIGRLIVELVGDCAADPASEASFALTTENRIALGEATPQVDRLDQLGARSAYACPSCSGPLWEMADERVRRYRCYVGHAFTGEALLEDQSNALSHSLSVALRVMADRERLLRLMAEDHARSNRDISGQRYVSLADELSGHAERLRELVRRFG